MAITPRPVDGSYDRHLYEFIRESEGFVPRVYTDHRGIPTLGIGYALLVSGAGWPRRDGLANELAAVGVALTAEDEQLLDDVQAALAGSGADAAKALVPEWRAGEDSAALNRFSFLLTDVQGEGLFAAIRPNYERAVATRIGQELAGALANSYEMVTLFSLAYNNPSLIGPGLRSALETGDRAAVWYEIRFRSNSKRHRGLQNRRDAESDEFGLYNNNADSAETTEVKAFLDDKREFMRTYLARTTGTEDAGAAAVASLFAAVDARAENGDTALA